MRVGEVVGLRWCDLDFENELISINHTLVYYSKGKGAIQHRVNEPKTEAGKRVIPMAINVKSAFLAEKAYQIEAGITCKMEIDGYTDFVFLNRHGFAYTQGTINKVLKRIIRDCNDEQFLLDPCTDNLLPQFSSRTFRHTFAIQLATKTDISLKALQQLMGHADIQTTMQIYVHANEAIREEQKLILNQVFGD